MWFMGRGSFQRETARTRLPGCTPGAARRWSRFRLPALPSVRPHAERGTDGRERQPAAALGAASRGGPWLLSRRRRPVRNGGAQGFRRYIRSPSARSTGVKHCKGDRVPTLRPLLAVTGPPRQYGPKPCSTWPLAGLQRPRPVHSCRSIDLQQCDLGRLPTRRKLPRSLLVVKWSRAQIPSDLGQVRFWGGLTAEEEAQRPRDRRQNQRRDRRRDVRSRGPPARRAGLRQETRRGSDDGAERLRPAPGRRAG